MTDTPKLKLEVPPALAAKIWRCVGLAQAFEALGGSKPKSTLPGFALAIALIEKDLADERANMSGEVYRTAARAGHDVANVAGIYTSILGSTPCVEIEFADIVDQMAT